MDKLGRVREVLRWHCSQNHRPVINDDPATTALISDVSAKSHAFALLWDSHAIEVHERKEKKIRYEELGEIRLDFELLTAIDTPKQFLVLHRTPAD